MSLFGGETSGSTSAYEPDSPIPASSLPPPTQDDLPNAQLDPTLYSNIDLIGDDADDDLADIEEEDEEIELEDEDEEQEEDAGPSRPNRFTGSAASWRRYTAEDRHIAASLDQIQSGDLAAHLYNAHALKRRVRVDDEGIRRAKEWQGKDSWLKKGTALKFVDVMGEEQMELVPAKRWTAWPFPVGKAPRGVEGFARRIGGEEGVGDELREEMLAVFLRLAKDRWREDREERDASDERIKKRKQKVRSKSKGARSEHSASSAASTSGFTDSEGEDDDVEDRCSDMEIKKKEPDTVGYQVVSKRRGRQPSEPSTRATILTDDDRARQILKPTINSMLTQLDSLAVAIRRTRLNHFGRGTNTDTSGSEFISDADTTMPESGSTSRSRTRSRSKSVPKRKAASRKAQPRKKSRKNAIPLDDSDSESDYGADNEPGIKLPKESDFQAASGKERSGSTSRRGSTSSLTDREASVQVGLMDWSEVLGLASMTGWNEKAVARTAQRCATLFGEGMSFRSFDEGLGSKPVPAPVVYTPSMIPPPNVLGAPHFATTKRPLFEKGTLRCPHTDCRGHNEDFKIPYRVIEHVQRVHGYDPRTNDSDNEDRKVGGVHIDGFLQPITAKKGWLGAGRSKSESTKQTQRVKKGKTKIKTDLESPEHILVTSSPPPLG